VGNLSDARKTKELEIEPKVFSFKIHPIQYNKIFIIERYLDGGKIVGSRSIMLLCWSFSNFI
jgi:hypothetical protein